jgi:8-oxo-dGTP diphosphatase
LASHGQALSHSPSPVPAVIAVLIHEGQALLVRRANPPDAGLWGFPGGKIEYGETVKAAAMRELLEETSVLGEAQDIITTLDILVRSDAGELQQHYILIAVRCRWLSGIPLAGDDALEARWFPMADLDPGRIAMSADVEVIARRAEALVLNEDSPED